METLSEIISTCSMLPAMEQEREENKAWKKDLCSRGAGEQGGNGVEERSLLEFSFSRSEHAGNCLMYSCGLNTVMYLNLKCMQERGTVLEPLISYRTYTVFSASL